MCDFPIQSNPKNLSIDLSYRSRSLAHSPQSANVSVMVSYLGVLASLDMHDWTNRPGRVAQLVGHLTHKSGVLGSIPGLATYFRFSFRFFKKGSCQLLAKVCARSTG